MAILISTYAKLAKNAMLYRVDFPAFVFAHGMDDQTEMPAHHEHFASRAGAIKAQGRYPDLKATITIVRASDFNPLTDR